MRQFPKILISFFIGVLPSICSAQQHAIAPLETSVNTDSLRLIYGKQKHFLKEYELPSLFALSYYPELENDVIYFKYRSINSCAQTTMTIRSIFNKTDKKYIIYLNEDTARTGMILSDAPLEAQVAVLGHELAHVTDFKGRGFLELVMWALRYLFAKQSSKIERLTDMNTIEHGLGWPLYRWAEYFINESKANKHYRKIRQKKYLHPDEIAAYIRLLKIK